MAVPSAVAGLLRRPARLGDAVYAAIFERIMALEVVPGERISVDAVARQLGVSQTPIREAMARLESEGLVRKTPLVGYSATPRLSPPELADLFEMRLQLEPFAARKCAALMPDAVIEQLETLCREMAELADREGLAAYAYRSSSVSGRSKSTWRCSYKSCTIIPRLKSSRAINL